MSVIIAVIGIFLMVTLFSNAKGKHSLYEKREKEKRKYYALYRDTYEDNERRIRELKEGKHIERLESIYSKLPNFDSYQQIAYLRRKSTINIFILCVLDGKIPYDRNPAHWPDRKSNPEGYEFVEALLDWAVEELKTHGMTVPLFAKNEAYEQRFITDWRGKVRVDESTRFFVPYKDRPPERVCELVWNFNNDPPIYPRG